MFLDRGQIFKIKRKTHSSHVEESKIDGLSIYFSPRDTQIT